MSWLHLLGLVAILLLNLFFTRSKETNTTPSTRLPRSPMATTTTTRKAPGGTREAGGDPSVERGSKERRVRSPSTAVPTKSGSRPSSATGSPEKSAGNKSIPNYLRSISSSRNDVPAKKPTTTATKKPLTRISSMDQPHPAAPSPASSQPRRVQPSRSLKEPTSSKAPATMAAATSRTSAGRNPKASPSPAARPNVGAKTRSQATNSKSKKKEMTSSASLSGSPRGAIPLQQPDFLETRSESEITVAPVAKLTPEEDDDLVDEDVDATTISVEPCRQIEEHVVHVSEEKQEVKKEEEEEPIQQEEDKVVVVIEETKKETQQSSSLGRPKSLTHKEAVKVTKTTRVDDELQRKLMKRQAWEADKDVGSTVLEGKVVVTTEGTTDNENNAAAAKKEGNGGNEAIEEAAGKLSGEKRKNKVLALVGAFETVMSFQEQPETPSQAKAPDGESAFDRELGKQEGETKEEEEEEVSQVTQLAEKGIDICNGLRSEQGPVLLESTDENAAEEEEEKQEEMKKEADKCCDL